MATQRSTVEFVLDQLEPLNVRARAMFGEYGIYCDEKFVAMVCDDVLYVKPTAAGERLLAGVPLAPPYPHAKNHYGIPGDRLDDREWLQEVFRATAEALPAKKPRKR